jgi:hypothetical protein
MLNIVLCSLCNWLASERSFAKQRKDPASENVFQSELNNPRIGHRRGNHSKRGHRLIVNGNTKLGGVSEIKKFGSELQMTRLGYGKTLLNSQVQVSLARAP